MPHKDRRQRPYAPDPICGNDTRFDVALHSALAGQNEWVDRTDIDSCHRVWFQLHEDLLATLGIDRRTEY